jgi:hypothetical protein
MFFLNLYNKYTEAWMRLGIPKSGKLSITSPVTGLDRFVFFMK